jgi:HK97 gp10 family phage protein
MSVLTSIEGLEEVIKKLDNILNDTQMNEAMGKACAVVERSARQKAPKGEGELRRSIHSKVENGDGIVYSTEETAPYIEYGTGLYAEEGNGRKEVPWVYVEGSSNSSPVKKTYTEEEADRAVAFLQSKGLDARKSYGRHPEPFMRPALYENKDKIMQILQGGLNND